jgi:hypothetical protein
VAGRRPVQHTAALAEDVAGTAFRLPGRAGPQTIADSSVDPKFTHFIFGFLLLQRGQHESWTPLRDVTVPLT